MREHPTTSEPDSALDDVGLAHFDADSLDRRDPDNLYGHRPSGMVYRPVRWLHDNPVAYADTPDGRLLLALPVAEPRTLDAWTKRRDQRQAAAAAEQEAHRQYL